MLKNIIFKMKNVEIKAKVKNLEALLLKAEDVSQQKPQLIKQHDTFYNVSQGRLKLRKFHDETGELIYYERPDTEGPKLSSYEKASFDDKSLQSLNSVLKRALGEKSVVQKIRYLFLVGPTRIHVDVVENLGNFMELEVVLQEEQSLEEGEKIAKDLMKKLGIGEEDLISGAYTDLLAKNAS